MPDSHTKKIDVYGLSSDEIHRLRDIAHQRYGKASVSLLAKKLLQETLRQPESPIPSEVPPVSAAQRLTLRLPPAHRHYLAEKSRLQHSSLNETVRDIIAEHIQGHPVLSNHEVQALYQSNYQLLRLGRNINQIARQLNSIMPQSVTTRELNALLPFLQQHTETVGRVLRKQGKPFKYRPIGEHHATTEQTD